MSSVRKGAVVSGVPESASYSERHWKESGNSAYTWLRLVTAIQLAGCRGERCRQSEGILTVICCLTMGICSENCIARQFHCVTIIECTYTHLDNIAHYTLTLYGARSLALLQACTACYSTRQHELNANPRENDALKKRGTHEMDEAATGLTQHTVLQQTFCCKGHSKITVKSIVC